MLFVNKILQIKMNYNFGNITIYMLLLGYMDEQTDLLKH